MGREASGGFGVEYDEVCRGEGIEDLLSTSRRAGVARLREPRGAVSIEVPQDNSITLGREEIH